MTSARISAELRQRVSNRAQGRCEYCLIHQDFSIYTHEVDHIIAQKHDGQTTAENLALACFSCNRHKGTDIATLNKVNRSSGFLTICFRNFLLSYRMSDSNVNAQQNLD